MKRGFLTMLAIWWITYVISSNIGFAMCAVVVGLILLPPKYDPAIQIKEAQIKAGTHPES